MDGTDPSVPDPQQQLQQALRDENLLNLVIDDSELPLRNPDRKKLWSLLKQSYQTVCELTEALAVKNCPSTDALEDRIMKIKDDILTAVSEKITDAMKPYAPSANNTTLPAKNLPTTTATNTTAAKMNYAKSAWKKPTTHAQLSLSGDSVELSTTSNLLKSVPTTFVKNKDDGSVLIGFESEEVMRKTKDSITQLNPTVKAEGKMRKKKLTIRNADVASFSDENDESASTNSMSKELRDKNDANILEMLFEKNHDVKELVDAGESIDIIYFRRNYHEKNMATIAIRVSQKLFDFMLTKGFVFMGNSFSRVEERFHVRQCFKCQLFGHLSSVCTENTDTCYHCAGPHSGRDCDSKDIANRCCANCSRSTNPHFKAGSSTHNAASRDCPIYQRRVQASKNY
jgi:hypothetical protein